MLKSFVIDSETSVCDLSRPAFDVSLPYEHGWRIANGNDPQKIDMLITNISSVITRDGIGLAITRKVTKDEAMARVKEIAADIAPPKCSRS